MAGEPQFDGQNPVTGYTLFQGKDGKSFYLKGEGLSDEDVTSRVAKLRGATAEDPLTAKTQATAQAAGASTTPAPKPKEFEKPPVGTPFPSTNPIEKAGQRLDLLGERENRAQQSPTPATNATMIIDPAAGLSQAIESGGIRGAAKAVGRGALKSVASGMAGTAAGAGVGELVGHPKEGAQIGATTGMLAGPFISDGAFAHAPYGINRLILGEEGLADAKAASEVARRAARERAGLNKTLPPPPDPEYVRQKTITEAQEAATSQNKKFDANARKAAEKVAADRNAQYQREADETMAIQKRADDAAAAAREAEKQAKNTRLKNEQAHEKALAEIEASRQKELAATEKLRNIEAQSITNRGAEQGQLDQAHADRLAAAEKELNDARVATQKLRTWHGSDLMKRESEQKALDKQVQDAAEEETEAHAAKTAHAAKPKVTYPGDSGIRPTETEQTLTNLFKKRIWTPEDFKDAVNAMGPRAYRLPGEGQVEYQARVMGMIRSPRAGIGMEDAESGPVAAARNGNKPKIPPPPAPTSQPPLDF